MKNILLAVFLLATAQTFSQTFLLTVNSGYGSGNFNAGDTVDIWCSAIPANNVFDKWTVDISFLESNDEWHTTLVMPEQNVSVTANFKSIGTVNINYEKIMGRDTIKNVYSYFPQNFKGVIFCFHGTGGAASNWTTLLEYKQFLNDAVADTFGFIITEAEEITKQTDFDGNGKLRWAAYPVDTISNVDYANIKILMDTFRLRGITNAATKYYAVGMSNGGNFAPAVATAFNWKAAVSYCAQSAQLLMNTTTVPVQWCMARYDNNDNVGSAGNIAALANSNTLQARGICTKYFLHDRSPIYAERFMRSGTVNLVTANNLLAEFQTNNLLDANNYLLYASDTIGARIIASPSSYPIFISLTGAQKSFVGSQVDAMYAAHQFYSDYNKKTFRFFDSQCDTVAIPSAVTELKSGEQQFKIFPNPTNSVLQIINQELPDDAVAEIFDAIGERVFYANITSAVFSIQTFNWRSGVYLLKIGNTVKKFVKE